MTNHHTDRAEMILRFMHRFMHEHGSPPSVRDIAAAIGVASSGTVSYHLRALAKVGRIRHAPRHSWVPTSDERGQ